MTFNKSSIAGRFFTLGNIQLPTSNNQHPMKAVTERRLAVGLACPATPAEPTGLQKGYREEERRRRACCSSHSQAGGSTFCQAKVFDRSQAPGGPCALGKRCALKHLFRLKPHYLGGQPARHASEEGDVTSGSTKRTAKWLLPQSAPKGSGPCFRAKWDRCGYVDRPKNGPDPTFRLCSSPAASSPAVDSARSRTDTQWFYRPAKRPNEPATEARPWKLSSRNPSMK